MTMVARSLFVLGASLATLLAALLVCAPAEAGKPLAWARHSRSCRSSPNTTIELKVTKLPKYDGESGVTRLMVNTRGGGSSVWKGELEGLWRCLGFSRQRGAYILGGEFQQGAWLPVRKIKYLDESTHQLRDSRANGRNWLALSSEDSADGRYIALVGQMQGKEDFVVFVLDTARDRMRTVGKAPAPPPLPDEIDGLSGGRWAWGDIYDGYVLMDRGIISFRNGNLVVSYGRDGPKGRSPKRQTKTWSLEQLLGLPGKAKGASR